MLAQLFRMRIVLALPILLAAGAGMAQDAVAPISALGAHASVGDMVFIRVAARPFREVAAATNSWTNHVGVVVDTAGAEPLVAESTFPFSRVTTLSRFAARSEGGRLALARLTTALSPQQQARIREAASRRTGIFYDTGFDLHSQRQFCSRFVREVVLEATGVQVGTVESFETLFAQHPETNLGFWKMWYFGRIPWQRETVTPASLLQSDKVSILFDGIASAQGSRPARAQ